ncbi:hypothetical protein C8R34_10382 [Nitrosomonas sp. Nm84]|uniref:hypothetical protein n=1 Tax=Nitrosomonas sp. Nm84 TaxID=200124 RepID=UPI000D751A51|nr:hypothetical protein [Nitrosomonas sp. Nm84]PXW89925.1 hypothetical protein C8R34_10382 [Nitrosomonas sp. Nm84]
MREVEHSQQQLFCYANFEEWIAVNHALWSLKVWVDSLFMVRSESQLTEYTELVILRDLGAESFIHPAIDGRAAIAVAFLFIPVNGYAGVRYLTSTLIMITVSNIVV